MAKIDLEKMALKELVELEQRVRKQIAVTKEKERANAKDELEQRAEELGFSVTELFATGKKVSGLKGSKVAAKFVNPDDRGETWSGRGRQPRWLKAKLDAGANLEDFAV